MDFQLKFIYHHLKIIKKRLDYLKICELKTMIEIKF